MKKGFRMFLYFCKIQLNKIVHGFSQTLKPSQIWIQCLFVLVVSQDESARPEDT